MFCICNDACTFNIPLISSIGLLVNIKLLFYLCLSIYQRDKSVGDLVCFYMYFMDNVSGLVLILCVIATCFHRLDPLKYLFLFILQISKSSLFGYRCWPDWVYSSWISIPHCNWPTYSRYSFMIQPSQQSGQHTALVKKFPEFLFTVAWFSLFCFLIIL